MDLASFGTLPHATNTSGVIAGAGLIDPFYGAGYAPKAHIILRNFSDILWDAPQYLNDFGLTLTNNSYGQDLTNCTYFGDYDGNSSALDAMMYDHPQLLHVFSAANSGGMTCTPFPGGYATIGGGYQPAKNVLTVGAVNIIDGIASFSSRGPVDDGRLKPEVVAYGVSRFMTVGTNQYASGSGTSFSGPAVVGCATLLYERFKQLHHDSIPEAALIKNVICNAADDLGPAGPDYLYGFGRINGDRAARILEDNHFFSIAIDQDEVMTRTFSIPSGTSSADVMMLWTDQPSAPYETVTLVNDLDLTIVTPNGDTIKPWILNPTPAGVSSAASTGVDRFNNYEQVSLSNPVAGTYTMVIKGAIVPLGPQKSWLSWDLKAEGIKVQSPNGGETLKPGNNAVSTDRQYIRWDAFGTGASTFTVEYTTNDGSSWAVLASGIPASVHYLDWFPPAVVSEQVMVRVTASNGMQDISDHDAIIMSPPTNLTTSSPCNGNVQLSWTAIPGAGLYKIFVIKNETLIPVDTTSATTYMIRHLPVDSSVWVTVAGAFISGAVGLRARAIAITANGGNACPWMNDLRVDSLVDIHTGRQFTSTQLVDTEKITVHLTNLGTTAASGFSLTYQVNSNPPVMEAVGDILPAGTSINFTFGKPVDLSQIGTYTLKVWTTYAADPFFENDTLRSTIRQLANPMVALPWNEDFESTPDTIVLSDQNGMNGLEPLDIHLTSGARLRTHAGTPFCHDGMRAVTVDAVRTGSSKSGDMVFTLNMSGYTVTHDDVRFSFQAMHHEIFPDNNNTEAVWIRGADTLPYVLLSMIPNDAFSRGIWQTFSGLKLSETLSNAGQEYSSSFQIRFTFDVYATAGQIDSQDGETLDDLSLELIQKDVAVTGILHPVAIECDLGVETIMATITNTSVNEISNVSVVYRVNGEDMHTTFIGQVPADTSIVVSLTPDYDFSNSGVYSLEVWTSSPEDDFHRNDTLRVEVIQNTLITSFPYLEGFENGPGDFHSDGRHNSWAYGVPGKSNFSRAAEGDFVWTTSLRDHYQTNETSYLYSPCFDLTGLAQPWLSFAWVYQLETGYDFAWVEYRLAGSTIWQKLGTQGNGVNWYNHASNSWNGNQLNWMTTGMALPVTDTIIQFRWVMQSDEGVELEGLAIDQVHIYDRQAIYGSSGVTITQPVSGNDWVHFNSGGQRIFSVNPMGQDLGDVTITLYSSPGNVQLTDSMYLLSRDWVISSVNPPQSPIEMRGYYTGTEASALVNASGCDQCISVQDGFDVAALRYTGINQDGDFANDDPMHVITYDPDSTQVVPYDNGYYAEWKTSGMSEWWITSPVTKWSGNIDTRISSGSDDAEEHEFNGAVNPYRTSLALTEKDGHQQVGWRFDQIHIPQGSYIHSAHVVWESEAIDSDSAHWTLQSEMSANAATFTPAKYSLSQRPRSTQVVQWSPEPWNEADLSFSSPDIKHVLQQVIDQSSWVTGHSLALILRGDGLRQAWSYEGDSILGARLMIAYQQVCEDTGICYVDQNATGTQDGDSWANAYRSVEQALDRTLHCPDMNEIWIAGGSYTPFGEVNRTNGFSVRSGVQIYGGFQGTENAISERIEGMYPTVLSGDIGIQNATSDNLYHVITIQAGPEQTLLDGIWIRDGMANGSTLDLQRGSAIYNLGNLKTRLVRILNSSAPSVYSAPGSILDSAGLLEVKQ